MSSKKKNKGQSKSKSKMAKAEEEPKVFMDTWVSAVDRSKLYPEFEAPTEARLAALNYGDHVKICNRYNERFWVMVCVRNRSEKVIIGEVCSLLMNKVDYDLGDLVAFHEDHVFVTAPKEDVEIMTEHSQKLTQADRVRTLCPHRNIAYENMHEKIEKYKNKTHMVFKECSVCKNNGMSNVSNMRNMMNMMNIGDLSKHVGEHDGRKVFSVVLFSASALTNQYPEFEAPSVAQLKALTVGDQVRVCNGYERFWAEIKECSPSGFLCEVVSDLSNEVYKYKKGDLIVIADREVYSFMSSKEAELALAHRETFQQLAKDVKPPCFHRNLAHENILDKIEKYKNKTHMAFEECDLCVILNLKGKNGQKVRELPERPMKGW